MATGIGRLLEAVDEIETDTKAVLGILAVALGALIAAPDAGAASGGRSAYARGL